MKILSIGNSFSVDAHRYLHEIARADGEDMCTWNLYIGGCSLSRHYDNMQTGCAEYELQENGKMTGRLISLREALEAQAWDVVTLQQASHKSVHRSSFQPYLTELAAYVRSICPQAQLLMHQTWAYAAHSERLCMQMGFATPEDMFAPVEENYRLAVREIRADGMIPAGQAMLNLYHLGVTPTHRDPIHASLGVGRLTLALTWYGALTKKTDSLAGLSGVETDEPISTADRALAAQAAENALIAYRIGGERV